VRGSSSHENVHRKDFTDAERLAITEALAERERAAAKARQEATRLQDGKPPGGGKLPPPGKGKTRDHVARATGVSPRTAGKLLPLGEASRTGQHQDLRQVEVAGAIGGKG